MKGNIKYISYKPDDRSKDFISCFWFFENISEEGEHFTILPDGCFDMIIKYNDNKIISSSLTGLWNMPVIIHTDNSYKLFGIRFKPLSIEYLLKQSLKNELNRSAAFVTSDLQISEEQLLEYLLNSVEETILFVTNKILYVLEKEQIDSRYNILYNSLYNISSSLTIDDISKSVNLSTRQIHRKFYNLTGISPKTYSNIIRFKKCIQNMNQKDNSLFYDFGYYDQSHYIKEIKRFSGVTPNNLLKDVRFLQFFTANES